MRELRSHLGRHQPQRSDPEAESGPAGAGTASWSLQSRTPRLTWPERELIRQLGVKLYGGRPEASRGARGSNRTRVHDRPLEEVREKDPDGRIVVHHRTVDSLGKMLRAGTITQELHDAAKDFQAAFIVANLDPIRALPILRVTGAGCAPDLNARQLRRVHNAMQAPGGISSPAGSCVWHVVGLQRSVREWAIRMGSGGRPVRQEQAQGILVAALGVLAGELSG